MKDLIFQMHPQHEKLRRMADDLVPLCREGRFLCLYPHIDADGDALGSSCALAAALRKIGAKAVILASEAVPEKLFVIPESLRDYVVSDQKELEKCVESQDAGVVLDCPGGNRIASRQPYFESAKKQWIVDHHFYDGEDVYPTIRDTKASATCELVGYLIMALESSSNIEIFDRDIATSLMTGLLTDTGRFTFPNTRSETMMLAGYLLKFNVPLRMLSMKLFDERTEAKLRLQGYVGLNTEFYHSGRAAYCYIPEEFSKTINAVETDFEGLASDMRCVENVDVAVLLRRSSDGRLKGSVRSGQFFDSQQLAGSLGGGGHKRAAGFSIHDCADEQQVKNKVIENIGMLLDKVEERDGDLFLE